MKRGALGLLVVLMAGLLAVFGVRRAPDPALYPASGPAVVVYVVDNGFHSNVVLPRSRVIARGGPSAAALAELEPGPWVAVGWGDERFFTESGASLRRAMDGLRALFAPNNPSVVMFEPLPGSPDRLWRQGVVRLELSEAGFERMLDRIDGSFVRAADGRLVPGPRGPSPRARFFKSREAFSLVKLCNHWTSEVLHAAGVPTRPVMDTVGAGMGFDLRTWAATLDSGTPRR